ncbi:hypothetical protein OPQ81_008176 [Rhizoctonia solani]|nr:hypothetical protein OPQ81_008176 [Rhizoctonia solani]
MSILSHARILAFIALISPPSVLAHQTTRRSLNFSPHLKANFFNEPLPILSSRDPYQTAYAFLRQLAYPDDSYFIRKDSYTDENTGVSHIYVRQVVNGLEVADGNINLNIRDGQVLSYGNSFFEGSPKFSLLSVPNWHQAVFCSEVPAHISHPACGSVLDHLQVVASHHTSNLANYLEDPRAATFFFLQVAHPTPSSLAFSLVTLTAKPHNCIDPCKKDLPCKGWIVAGHSDELGPVYAHQVYVQTPGTDGSTYLNLAWRLETSLPENHYVAYVSVHDPTKIISMADLIVDAPTPDSDGLLNTLERYIFGQLQEAFSSHDPVLDNSAAEVATPILNDGTYRVWKWGINDPESGERTLEVEPKYRRASPLGWHSMPAENDPLGSHSNMYKNVTVTYTTTVGNNVIAQENWAGGKEWKTNGRANGGSDLVFDFPYGADPSQPDWQNIEPREYGNTSVTQLFYMANMYHDLLYSYGFDEASGNFQQYNFGKRGEEGDAIVLDAQDGEFVNAASFNITADGEQGVCRMHLWNHSNPMRDGGLDAGILIHELSHGLSGRLTGGPCNPNCLTADVSKGLGEGWSDFIATTVRSTRIYKDYPIGAWAYNNRTGYRNFLYSTNFTVNPTLYDRLQDTSPAKEHDIGEIWAQILYVVSNKLIEKHGFSDSLFPSSDSDFYRFIPRSDGSVSKVPNHGNTLMLQLIINAMKTQCCNPTFLQARQEIIGADLVLTGGENHCTLWGGLCLSRSGYEREMLAALAHRSLQY